MKFRPYVLPFLIAACLVAGAIFSATPATAKNVGIMNIDTLAQLLDSPDLVILDVRTGRDWKSSTQKIKGARRAEPGKFSSWSGDFPKGKKIVLYCA